jgi:hypothetical protein
MQAALTGKPGRRAPEPDEDSGRDEQPGYLGFSGDRDRGQQQVDGPQQPILAHAFLGQFFRAHHDDADDGRADAIEHRLHPRQAAETHVGPAQDQHNQELARRLVNGEKAE